MREEAEAQIETVGAAIPTATAAFWKMSSPIRPTKQPNARWCSSSPTISSLPTGRPGNVIDFFSRTGLFIVGVKVLRMSTAQAMEFYGPVREFLRTKLKDGVSAKAKDILEKEFGFKISAADQKALGDILGPDSGDNQFDNIVRFMSGHAPGEIPEADWTKPGTRKVHRAGL